MVLAHAGSCGCKTTCNSNCFLCANSFQNCLIFVFTFCTTAWINSQAPHQVCYGQLDFGETHLKDLE